MKIQANTNVHKFGVLLPGDLFGYRSTLYLKVFDKNGCNAVVMSGGHAYTMIDFEDDANVEFFPDATITLTEPMQMQIRGESNKK